MTITLESLIPPHVYSVQRALLRPCAIAYRRLRTMQLGAHAMPQFEDGYTVRLQIQEMLRAEGILDEEDMQEQIDCYLASAEG